MGHPLLGCSVGLVIGLLMRSYGAGDIVSGNTKSTEQPGRSLRTSRPPPGGPASNHQGTASAQIETSV